MTTQELIEKLKEFPPDTEIIVPGVSDIYNNLETLELKGIHLNYYEPNKAYYFENQLNYYPNRDDTKSVIVISGNKIVYAP